MDIHKQDDQARRLREARLAAGFETAKKAAARFGFNYTTYSQHERGQTGITRAASDYAKAFRVSEAWLLTGEGSGHSSVVDIVGRLGAGAEVETEFEQGGLGEVELPFPLPAEMIALEVYGESMLPVYKNGHIIVVYKHQKKPLTSFFGEVAAVKLADGRRFIKTIMRGDGDAVNLWSWNAEPIENVQLEWIGEIFATLPRHAVHKIPKQGGIQGQLGLKSA
jgi:phage repressor protein C with HTH and peptisase S24 domain